MTSIATPLQFIPAMYTKLTDIDWAHHRTQFTISAGIFIGYLLSILMLLGMGILAIGRAFNYLRRRLPAWLQALATQLDRFNAWLDEGEPRQTLTAQPVAAAPSVVVTTEPTPQPSPRSRRNRSRRRQHIPA